MQGEKRLVQKKVAPPEKLNHFLWLVQKGLYLYQQDFESRCLISTGRVDGVPGRKDEGMEGKKEMVVAQVKVLELLVICLHSLLDFSILRDANGAVI